MKRVATPAGLGERGPYARAIGNSAAPMVSSGSTAQANELVLGYAEVTDGAVFTLGTGYVMDATVPSGTAGKLVLEHSVAFGTSIARCVVAVKAHRAQLPEPRSGAGESFSASSQQGARQLVQRPSGP